VRAVYTGPVASRVDFQDALDDLDRSLFEEEYHGDQWRASKVMESAKS
jgi:hypothetical protein